MADRIEIDIGGGRKAIVNSVKTAAKLIRELGQNVVRPELEEWSLDDFEQFTDKLQYWPKRIVAFLLESNSATDTEIRDKLHFHDNRALAGTLSGVTKIASSLGLRSEQVYTQVTKYEKGKPIRQYKISPAFRDAARRSDWPSADDLKPDEE
jgi:hypothetical protein